MSYSNIRAEARERLAGNWMTAALVTLVAMLLGGLSSSGFDFEINFNINSSDIQIEGANGISKAVIEFFKSPGFQSMAISGVMIGAVVGIALSVIGTVINQGYARYALNLCDGWPARFDDLFSQFKYFGKVFVLYFLMGLYTALWGLLFVIPGIVASYRYAMAPYILLDNPELTPSECISRSKEIMYGNKADLFVLELTFIGWAILTVFTLGVGNLFLQPYIAVSKAVFYRKLASPPVQPARNHIPWSEGNTKYL